MLLHCLDHIAASAQSIKKHNEALKADPLSETPRDQGFTRPKVSEMSQLLDRTIVLSLVVALQMQH